MNTVRDAFRLLRDRKWVALSAGGLAVASGILLWVAVPRARSAYASYRAWQQKEARIRSAQHWKRQLRRLRGEQKKLRRRLDSLFVRVPEGDQMSSLLTVLQKHARHAGVSLRRVQPQARTVHASYEELPLSVALTGRYHSIARFVDRVERSRYLMRVERMLLRAERMVSDTLRAQVRLSLVTLRRGSSSPADSSGRGRSPAPAEGR